MLYHLHARVVKHYWSQCVVRTRTVSRRCYGRVLSHLTHPNRPQKNPRVVIAHRYEDIVLENVVAAVIDVVLLVSLTYIVFEYLVGCAAIEIDASVGTFQPVVTDKVRMHSPTRTFENTMVFVSNRRIILYYSSSYEVTHE